MCQEAVWLAFKAFSSALNSFLIIRSSLFYKWGNPDSESLHNFPNTKYLVKLLKFRSVYAQNPSNFHDIKIWPKSLSSRDTIHRPGRVSEASPGTGELIFHFTFLPTINLPPRMIVPTDLVTIINQLACPPNGSKTKEGSWWQGCPSQICSIIKVNVFLLVLWQVSTIKTLGTSCMSHLDAVPTGRKQPFL